jgi:hypothetical protein
VDDRAAGRDIQAVAFGGQTGFALERDGWRRIQVMARTGAIRLGARTAAACPSTLGRTVARASILGWTAARASILGWTAARASILGWTAARASIVCQPARGIACIRGRRGSNANRQLQPARARHLVHEVTRRFGCFGIARRHLHHRARGDSELPLPWSYLRRQGDQGVPGIRETGASGQPCERNEHERAAPHCRPSVRTWLAP